MGMNFRFFNRHLFVLQANDISLETSAVLLLQIINYQHVIPGS